MGCTGRVAARLSTLEVTMDEEEPGSPRGALIALIVVVVLVVGGLWVTHELRAMASIQDCASSGRTNCAPIRTN